MAKTKSFRQPKHDGVGSKKSVDLVVLLNSIAWSSAAIAGWLTSLRHEVDEYGGREAVADLLAASEVLSAGAKALDKAGFEVLVPMPPGVSHVTPDEWLEEEQAATDDHSSSDDLPF